MFLTEKGKSLDQAHRQFDEEHSGESINQVRKFYSDKEINLAFDVLETWLSVRRRYSSGGYSRKKKPERNKCNCNTDHKTEQGIQQSGAARTGGSVLLYKMHKRVKKCLEKRRRS